MKDTCSKVLEKIIINNLTDYIEYDWDIAEQYNLYLGKDFCGYLRDIYLNIKDRYVIGCCAITNSFC
ncbi:MAG: hypothetical protein ACTSQG_09115 [Promethearchaeota archaeon]